MSMHTITGSRRMTMRERFGNDAPIELRLDIGSDCSVRRVAVFENGHESDADYYLRALNGTGDAPCSVDAPQCLTSRRR